jgi:hypothetical protein
MCEEENDQVCKNLWLITRCGGKCTQSIKNEQHQTLNHFHSMVMKQTNTAYFDSMKGLFEKLKARIKCLLFCYDKWLTWLNLSSCLNPNFISSMPNNFATYSIMLKLSFINIPMHIPICSFQNLISIIMFSYN